MQQRSPSAVCLVLDVSINQYRIFLSLQAHARAPWLEDFFRISPRCRVGGGAPCGAGLRPPLKLDVQISRIQLSQR
jgi:hypothetical protein